ncbi:MAG: type II toxin-antitoxin system PemK/MazF family toxin [Trueperaceae bacterium]|nr:type II toxin-antitoxin system PemK/MazF family toxin [Trueperaceae bacterium]
MARFVVGDIVVVPFPFSDLSQTRRRPALVVANLTGDDLILCQITTQQKPDSYIVTLDNQDLSSGQLKQNSYIRPNKLFTLDSSIILYALGHLKSEKLETVQKVLINIIKGQVNS